MPGRSGRWPFRACSRMIERAGDAVSDQKLAAESQRNGAIRQGKARSVICLFQHGGPSQMDLFDPKPALSKHHGKPYPGKLEIHFDKQAGKLLASPFQFRPHGQSGMVLSEIVPHLVADRRRPDAGALDDDRFGRSRGGAAADPHGQGPGRPADVGLVGGLRPGDGEPEPAGLRGPVRPRRPAG